VLLWSLLATSHRRERHHAAIPADRHHLWRLRGSPALRSGPSARCSSGRCGKPWQVWLLGVGGLFGYHFFYFTSLRNAHR
jgi:hypothetical protein